MRFDIYGRYQLEVIRERVAEPALGLIQSFLFSAPYEEMRLK
jgi:hypothetical protein